MTIFGNRDSGYGMVPTSEGEPAPEVPPVAPATSQRAFGAIDMRQVTLRLVAGDPVLVGRAEGRDNAVRIAREMVQHVEQASATGEWPQVDDRFIRPGAIVSIDVQRPE